MYKLLVVIRLKVAFQLLFIFFKKKKKKRDLDSDFVWISH